MTAFVLGILLLLGIGYSLGYMWGYGTGMKKAREIFEGPPSDYTPLVSDFTPLVDYGEQDSPDWFIGEVDYNPSDITASKIDVDDIKAPRLGECS